MICVSQAGASCPLTCALGIFMGAFHPAVCPNSACASAAPATEMLGAGSVHLALMFFIMENEIWRPENAHFFPLRGRGAASAGYHPHLTHKKSSYTCRQIHWNLVSNRSKKIVFYGDTTTGVSGPWLVAGIEWSARCSGDALIAPTAAHTDDGRAFHQTDHGGSPTNPRPPNCLALYQLS